MKYAMIATWKMSYDGLKDGLNRLKEGINLYERKNSIMPNI